MENHTHTALSNGKSQKFDFYSESRAKNKLERVCCKKKQKSPNQETGLGNRGIQEALNDTKLILND